MNAAQPAAIPSAASIQTQTPTQLTTARQAKVTAPPKLQSMGRTNRSSKGKHQSQQMDTSENNKMLPPPNRFPQTTETKSTKRPFQNQLQAQTQPKSKRSKSTYLMTSQRLPLPVTSLYYGHHHHCYYPQILPQPMSIRSHQFQHPPVPVPCTPMPKRITKAPRASRKMDRSLQSSRDNACTPPHGIRPKILDFSSSAPEEKVRSYTPGWTPLPIELPTPPWRTEEVGILLRSNIMSDIDLGACPVRPSPVVSAIVKVRKQSCRIRVSPIRPSSVKSSNIATIDTDSFKQRPL